MRFIGLGLLFALGLSASPLKAQSYPEEFHGIWAESCKNVEHQYFDVWMENGVLLTSDEGYEFVQPELTQLADGFIRPTSIYYDFIRLKEDAVLEVYFPPEDYVDNGEKFDAPPEDWNKVELVKCDALLVQDELLLADFFAFNRIVLEVSPLCAGKGRESCFEAFFNALDVSDNNALSTAEIARLLRMLVVYGAFYNRGELVETKFLAALYGSAIMVSGPVAKNLIVSFDYDASDDVSLDELLVDRAHFLAPEVFDSLFEEMEQADLDRALEDGLREIRRFLF